MKKLMVSTVASLIITTMSPAALAETDSLPFDNKTTNRAVEVNAAELHAGRNDVTFKSMGYDLAGHLYLPEGFDATKTYPSVVFSQPFNQVKEQTGAVYAKALAKFGYITIAFDHIGYGDSEGELRNNENPFLKIESIRDATSFMGTLPFVDRDKLFGLGVCASGGYMALAATTDKRLKAIATVSGMLGNQMSYFGRMDREAITALITAQNMGRQKAYESGVVDYVDALGIAAGKDAPKGTAYYEGYDFYMTERGGAQTYPNYSHLAPSFMYESPMLADAMSYAPYLYTPFIGIYGGKAGTAPLTVGFYEKASEPKKLVEVKDATHVSLYDNPQDVAEAIKAMDTFFQKHGS